MEKIQILSDDYLFQSGHIETKIERDYCELATILANLDGDTSADLEEFVNLTSSEDMTYIFRLSVIGCGYRGLSKVSNAILDLNKDDIKTYRFRYDNQLVPYYRYFANFKDFKAIGTIFEKRGVAASDLADFSIFVKGLSKEQYEAVLNGMPNGDYEKLFQLRAHN